MSLRLQVYLAQAGVASRRRAEELIATGAVKVNGHVVTTLGMQVEERDRVEVDGKRALRVDPVYRALLKPRACLATLGSAGDRTTLSRYVPNPEPGLTVAAPLDFPAEGVVLLTTDGALAAAIARRGQKVSMTYHIKFQGAIGEQEVERLGQGWTWEGTPVRPTAITPLATTGKNTWVEIVVPEIRPRALKAAGDLLRHSVLKVSRVRLGPISFDGLSMGEVRDLSKSEIAELHRAAGLTSTRAPKEPSKPPRGVVPERSRRGRPEGHAKPSRTTRGGQRPSGPARPTRRTSGPVPVGEMREKGPPARGGPRKRKLRR